MEPEIQSTNAEPYDVIVLGGGPGGSSAACRLAQFGRRVLVVEKESFPRFHVGESLLPLSNGLFERLGVDLNGLPQVEKYGATFVSECGGKSARIDFEDAPDVPSPRSLHARRADFDALLLEQAISLGAEVRQRCAALRVDCGTDVPTVRVRDQDGEEQDLKARFLLDASGRAGVLAKQLKQRVKDTELRHTALFAHFEGIPPPEGRARGDIQIICREGRGWGWMIPLPEGVMSVGFVFDNKERPKKIAESPDECLDRCVSELPLLDSCRESIVRVSSARWEADFSYSAKSYVGDNWLLIGDAGSFLDPVFSSGVQLALVAGIDAAEAVEKVLCRGKSERLRAFAHYDRGQRRRYNQFRRLVLGFYRPTFRELMFTPETWPAGARALASLLAGQDQPSWPNRVRVAIFFLLVTFKERFAPQPQ